MQLAKYIIGITLLSLIGVFAFTSSTSALGVALEGKTYKEQANLKAAEVAKAVKLGKRAYSWSGFNGEIEIVSVEQIEEGVQLLVRAWDANGNPIGFGADGSVEIERFRFFNPPLMVDDPTGTITKGTRKLKEDPERALFQTLAHTIKVVAKDSSTIVVGKVGNTTSTFFPATEDLGMYAQNATYATARNASTADATDNSNGYAFARLLTGTYGVARHFINFDTSPITDTDDISSATLSLTFNNKNGTEVRSYNIYDSTASDTVVAGDFDLYGSTAQSDNAITQANIVADNATYNDWAFNATGRAAINKTGYSKYVNREVSYDVGNTAPGVDENVFITANTSTAAGTTKDPKLVVVHAAPVPSTTKTEDDGWLLIL